MGDKLIGAPQFAGVVSNSTGNTKACRQKLTEKIPTMFNIPDSVHHTNLVVKDICNLQAFQKVSPVHLSAFLLLIRGVSQ